MPELTKTISVLHYVDLHGAEGDQFVTFQRRLDELGEDQRIVKLATADWVDLGEPETITITIEPGDKLNV